MANEEFVEKLIKERYCANNDEKQGDIWNNICKRVSNYLGTTEEEVAIFHDMMYSKDFLPNSPTLMNAGTETPMLSACFFLPISDCISNGKDGIFDQVKNAALIFKHGGGVGLNFSNLRPAGSKVKSTNGVSSGVISFMRNFNVMTETIKQGGKRRGALMGCLEVTHPEIKNFITCKTTEGDLSNFNISVKLTDEFMKNVKHDSPEELEIFNMIVDGIYKNGEPGLLFSDEIERHNPTPELGELNVNPCSEALLRSFESCNLGSITWSHLYKNSGKQWGDNIDWPKYEAIIRNSVILLNRVIDGNQYPLPEIDKATRFTRKIGLGGMGFHDLLLKLGIPYESEEALTVAKAIEIYLKTIAKNESDKHNFKNTSLTTIAPTGTISIIADVSSGIEPVFNWVLTRKDSIGEHYIVHPIFDAKLREILVPMCYYDKENIKIDLISFEKQYNAVIQHCHEKGTIQDMDWLPASFKTLFKNAMDIHWKHHIKMQAVFQTNGVDMSISKTINLPNNATKNDIGEAIFMAWEMHCKGLTIYRSGSREMEVLNLKKPIVSHEVKPETMHKEPEIIQELRTRLDDQTEETLQREKQIFFVPNENIRTRVDCQIEEARQNAVLLAVDEAVRASYKRPRLLYGGTYKVQSGCGKLYVTINERNGKPYEVFIQSGGSGGCEAGNQALGRTISLALRNGGDIRNIIKQLYKVKCPAALKNPRSEGKSCSDIVGKLITESIPDEDEEETHAPHQTKLFEECPDCHGKTLVRESGCKVCHACGYNKCG
jgi:ribonucleoside-diphosphate reductase alpha chain